MLKMASRSTVNRGLPKKPLPAADLFDIHPIEIFKVHVNSIEPGKLEQSLYPATLAHGLRPVPLCRPKVLSLVR
jgi:hypothetical protein